VTIQSGSHTGIAARVDDLVVAFQEIEQWRMGGMPLMNRALQVEAVGFEHTVASPDAGHVIGVLVTPWFMNLVALPLERMDFPLRVGDTTLRRLGGNDLVFLAAHEPSVGSFDACSLFSPVFEFPDPSAARATALAVLATLREVKRPDAHPVERPAIAEEPPARRSFLVGRTAARSGAR
jgi:[NiFe] hydrogenase assembly HybE family chaperone